MKKWLSIFAIFALYSLIPNSLAAENTDGPDAVKQIVARLEAAWNKHDMQAYGELFHDDAEWINVVGMYWRGKPQIVKAHTVFHETIFKECRLEGKDLFVRELTPDAVVAVWAHVQDAYKTPSGTQQEKTLNRLTLVITKRNGKWLISQGHNVWVNERAERSNPVNLP
jgi:uncharacterized protein (TIGR02246 family)